ncbi:type VII secretion protein EccE [Streptomyces sp. RFCAC02]|uniref:type VII secretion protein EccE n=1 Tax=Streptomyces sp. RFCAC02 TaxID=2499143 RepID=UPI0010214445|nr:type VII secretion protein EccE [Streptomyces sp. RFCAC02]
MTGGIARSRVGRGRLLAVESGAGALIAGVALGGGARCALIAAGAVVIVVALLRRGGTFADRLLLDRLGRDALAPASGTRRVPEDGGEEGLGLAHALIPVLDVTEFADRNLSPGAPGLGVLSDGRGCAAVLAFPGGTLPDLPAEQVRAWLAADPARPAAAQLVVEQFGLPPWDLQHGYGPTVAYRQLPGGPRPVAVRAWLVLRYEPFGASEAAERRGGGTAGARAATAAATARLRARLAAAGAPTTPLGAADLRDLLRQLGDAAGEGRVSPTGWAGVDATHCSMAVRVASRAEWSRLLSGLAGCAAERVVTAATLTADGPRLRVVTAVRVVSMMAQHAVAERERLLRAGVVPDLPTDQRAGLLATLPVAHPFRPLVETTGLGSPGALR